MRFIITNKSNKVTLYVTFNTRRKNYGVHYTNNIDEACSFQDLQSVEKFLNKNELNLDDFNIITISIKSY